MTGGLPQILCQSHDTLGQIDVCVGQSRLWSRGTGLAERGKGSTVCKRAVTFNVRASLIAQLVKNPPAIRETLVRFLGLEDALDKG